MSRHVHIVVNPEAGQMEPALAVIHAALRSAEVTWEVSVAKPDDDLPTLTRRAVESGADVVAAYGGDGTVSGVAEGLIGTGVPLAVLPGGTANVLSGELGLSGDLAASCAHVGSGVDPVEIDVIALENGRHALVHVGTGVPACAVAEADRAAKDGLGLLAYTVGGLKALWDPPYSRYRLVLDGREVETSGAACMVCNAGRIGQGGLALSPHISMCDGLLDVVVLRSVAPLSLLALARDLVLGREPASPDVQRWRVRTVEVEADPPQRVQSDGNMLGETPLRAHVEPGALRVLVPADAAIWNDVREATA